MTYTFGTQRLFKSLEKAAQYAVDGDIKAEQLCVCWSRGNTSKLTGMTCWIWKCS